MNNNNNNNIDDMFSVFNQTPTTEPPTAAPTTPPEIGGVSASPSTVAPITTTPPTPPKPVQATKPEDNLITVNNYVAPKEPFSLKNLLKKKMQEEEKTFNINDITNYTETRPKVDTEEEKEEKKKKSDLIKLILLLIVLVIVGFFAYRVFSNYLEPSQNIIINRNTNSNIINNDKIEVISYECNKPFDMTFYNFPYSYNIESLTYKGNTTYTFHNDKLHNITEQFTFLYINLDDFSKKEITDYCNKYNVVYDQYQLICKFSNNYLTITNSFNTKDISNKEIKNKLYTFNINYNKDTIVGDVLENDKTCRLKK